jgi:hypothetical protein
MACKFTIALVLLTLAALAQGSLPTNNDQSARPVPVRNLKAKPLCKECEKIVTALKKIVEDPQTEQELTGVLTKICNVPLLSSFKGRCLNMVNNVVVIIHELQSFLDNPTQVCDTIKLCDETPGTRMVSKRLLMSMVGRVVQEVRPAAVNIDTCGLCTSALDELKRMLQIPQAIEQITDEAQKLCKHLGPYEQTCDQVIGVSLPKLLQIVENALCQPQDTCAALHLCKQQTRAHLDTNRLLIAASHPRLDRFLANISSIQTARGIDVGCIACKTGVDAALKYLTRDSVITTMATDITDFVCKLLPDSLKPGCFDFLGIYGKTALQVTLTEWTPSQICSAAHACKTSSPQIFENLSAVEKSKLVCEACKGVSKTLAYELEQPALQQDIITVLTRVCLHLPGKYDNKCGDLVIEYIPFALGYVVDFFSRPDVCSVLRLC